MEISAKKRQKCLGVPYTLKKWTGDAHIAHAYKVDVYQPPKKIWAQSEDPHVFEKYPDFQGQKFHEILNRLEIWILREKLV